MEQPQFATKRIQGLPDVKVYQPFEGSNHKRMQRLLTGRENNIQVDTPRLPITPKQLMEVRLGRSGEEEDKKYLRSVYVGTSTAVLPNPDGEEVKFVHEHPLIYQLNSETELKDRNLQITPEQYAASNGFTLTREQADAFRKDGYALPNVRRELWEFLAEGDAKLAKYYEEDVARTLGMGFDKVMGIYVPSSKGLRLLGVYSVDGGSRSGAGGDDDLDYCNGRLVGVASESQDVEKKLGRPLESRVQ